MTSSGSDVGPPQMRASDLGAFAPLRQPIFRMLWLAALAGNIGEWMQTVGAQWFLLHTPGSTLTVPLVQAASSAPFLLLGIPAGVLGEFLNRRRLLIGVQLVELAAGALLTVLTAVGEMTPALLLVVTFVIGAASALQLPAYQALTPELVPARQIPAAATLSAASVNVGRVIGPAAAGVLIAGAGVPWTFGLDALSTLLFLVVLVSWRKYEQPQVNPEAFTDAAAAGLRYLRHSPVMRRLVLRVGLFLVPASAIWALLPLIATQRLHLTSSGYGVLLGALGLGSLLGAVTLPAARSRFGVNRTITTASAVFGFGLVGVAVVPITIGAIPILFVMGVCWIWVVSGFSGLAQSFFPGWVRARGLSLYQLVFFGSGAIGSTLAGAVATAIGVPVVTAGAGALVVLVAISQVRWRLIDQRAISRETTSLDLPADSDDVPVDAGVMVIVRWMPDGADPDGFDARIRQLGESRRRTGADHWALYRDLADPAVLDEVFTVPTWQEHRDQHLGRLTGYDREVLDHVEAASAQAPAVTHLIRLDPVRRSSGHPKGLHHA